MLGLVSFSCAIVADSINGDNVPENHQSFAGQSSTCMNNTMLARDAIQAFLTKDDPLKRLQAYVQRLLVSPNNEDPQLRLHAESVSLALAAATAPATPLNREPIVRIDDDFFTDLAGQVVTGADYSYTKLLGPDGPHFHDTVRCGISYQGPGLLYKGHRHVAQELYFVLEPDQGAIGGKGGGGGVLWLTGRTPAWEERNMSWHLTNEHHAMATSAESGALFFWSWTGEMTLDIRHA